MSLDSGRRGAMLLPAALLGMAVWLWPGAGEVAVAAQSPAPDLSGTWQIVSLPPPSTVPVNAASAGPPPILLEALPGFRPEVAARIAANARRPPLAAGAAAPDRGYCAPPAFTGPTGVLLTPGGRIPLAVEILGGPDRLTLLDEQGLIRRLYLRTQVPADALEESSSGNSIARWEGQTLVVQTSGLNSRARTISGIPGTELGRGAGVLERMSLLDPDTLQITATVTAPELYPAPVTTTQRYRRESRLLIEMSACTEADRAYDHGTRMERFDSTPPPDLPPQS